VKKFIGVDLHKKTITICAVNKDRRVLETRRFYCAEVERICDWFAAPGQRESAGRRRELGITHAGSGMLRWVLNQASWQLVQRSPRWRLIFEAIAKRRGKKKAITAISRRLLCVMTSIVNSGRPYQAAA